MPKKCITLILLYSSMALGSLENKEKQLIHALYNQYAACQQHWNRVSRYMSQGKLHAYKVAKMQAQSQEKNKRNAERALAKFQSK